MMLSRKTNEFVNYFYRKCISRCQNTDGPPPLAKYRRHAAAGKMPLVRRRWQNTAGVPALGKYRRHAGAKICSGIMHERKNHCRRRAGVRSPNFPAKFFPCRRQFLEKKSLLPGHMPFQTYKQSISKS